MLLPWHILFQIQICAKKGKLQLKSESENCLKFLCPLPDTPQNSAPPFPAPILSVPLFVSNK